MLVQITHSFELSCAHHLPYVPEGHKCKNVHGHNYTVELRIQGEVNPNTGFVMDYKDIKDLWKPLHDKYDHKDLNNIMDNPTAELLVIAIAKEFDELLFNHLFVADEDNSKTKLVEVVVKEKDKTSASVKLSDLNG